MRNIIFIFLFALLPFISFSQTYNKVATYGIDWKRGMFDSSFKVPVLDDTSRLSTVAGNGDIIYVNGSGFWGIEEGAYQRIMTGGTSNQTSNSTLGIIYNANNWDNLDDFTSNFSGFSIDGDNNIQFTSGSTVSDQYISLDQYTQLDRWNMTARIKVDTKNSTSHGFGMGIMDGQPLYVYFNMTDHAVQSGKLYFRASNLTLDSSTTGLSFSANDVLEFNVYYNYDNIKMVGTVTNMTSGNSVSVDFSAGEGQMKSLSVTALSIGVGKFSMFSRSGGWTLDSLDIYSSTIKNADIAFVGDSKHWGATPADMFKSYPKILMAYNTNSIMLAGSGNTIADIIDQAQQINLLNPKIVFLNIGYNSFNQGLSDDTINAQYARFISLVEDNDTKVISLLPQYDNIDQSSLRDWIIANREEDEYIDVYAATAQCGNACLADGIHPNEAGAILIANGILRSGKLYGRLGGNITSRYALSEDNGYNYNIFAPTRINTFRISGTQPALSLIHPLTASGDNPALDFYLGVNLRGRVMVGTDPALGYRFMSFGAGNTAQEIMRMRSDYGGLSIASDVTQAFVPPKPKLMVGGKIAIAAASDIDVEDTAFYLTKASDHDTRLHLDRYRISATSTNNYRQLSVYNGSGNYGQTIGIIIRGDERVGIATTSPTNTLHVNGDVRINTIATVTSYDSVLVVEDGVIKKILFPTVTSGTYTPTLTNVANLDTSTAYACQYLRVGNSVTVSGRVDIDPTLTTTSTQLGISLPISSNVSDTNAVAGTAFAPSIAGQGAAILGDSTNDRAQLQYISTDVTNQAMYFTFTYIIE